MQGRKIGVLFFGVYFLYYGAYSLFCGYQVSYLSDQGVNASLCGVIVSLTLLVSVIMQPVGGYLMDTWLSVKEYMMLSIAAIGVLCLLNTWFGDGGWLSAMLIVVSAAFTFPFIQLADAWVNQIAATDSHIIYSRIRAGGSIGFAITSMLMGIWFEKHGYQAYFLIQLALFAGIAPLLVFLPVPPKGNQAGTDNRQKLSFAASFRILLADKSYRTCLILFSLYWMSHRPVGSFLALIVESFHGGDRMFGDICAVGAVVEAFTLLMISWIGLRLSLNQQLMASLGLNLVRPLLFFTGWPICLYLGQAIQSISFAFFFAASVAAFTRFANPKIPGFSISVGLMFTNVMGNVISNLFGGMLCERYGAYAVIIFSMALSLVCFLLYFFHGRKQWGIL